MHKNSNSLLINLLLSHHIIHHLFQSADLLPIQVPISRMVNVTGERERRKEEEERKREFTMKIVGIVGWLVLSIRLLNPALIEN